MNRNTRRYPVARPGSTNGAPEDLTFDSGEVEYLPDGSISVPVLEEELVVTKRVIVRERIIIHKGTEIVKQRVDAELRRERVETTGVEPESGVAPSRGASRKEN